VEEYHDHNSIVRFTWEAPRDDSRVDYYQYQLINGRSYITSNTTATISGIAYKNNITFLLLSFNCVGVSSPLIEIIHIGKSNSTNVHGNQECKLINQQLLIVVHAGFNSTYNMQCTCVAEPYIHTDHNVAHAMEN
jgi:hypothetical protein